MAEKKKGGGPNKPNQPQLFVPMLPKTKSIFHAFVDEHLLLNKIPNHKVKKIESKNVINLSGPYNEETPDDKFFARAYGSSMSLYPMYKGNASREGDPICDSYRIQVHNNCTIFCIADGCNWGERPRQASNRAKDAFIGYLQSKLVEFKTLKDIGPHLVNALTLAHQAIIHDKEDIFMAGTTTLLGGILVKIDSKETDNQWVLLTISVGDCKIFHYVAADKKVFDITAANRQEVEDAKDPGGRIGPYIGDGDPDLRNLEVNCQTCHEGDVLICVSDGVHDNLDPITLGKLPKDLNLEGDNYEAWKSMEKTKKNLAKEKYMTDTMSKLIAVCPYPTPSLICKSVVRHTREVTAAGRAYMEQNPQQGLVGLSYQEYPGKMDHSTCTAFKVGEYDPNKREEGDNVQSLNQHVWQI